MLARMWSSAKAKLPGPGETLPGRAEKMPVPASTSSAARACSRRFPRAASWRRSASAASGARRRCSGAARRLQHRGRLRGRLDAESDLPRGLLGPDRTHRGGAGGVRPEAGELRRAPAGVLGEGTIRRRACDRATTSARSTARRSTRTATRSARRRPPRATRMRARWPTPASRRSRPRSRAAPEFFYAEDYHQQYLAKNPDGYCGIGGTGVSCPVGVGVAPPR